MILLGGFLHYRHPWQRLLSRTWLKLAKLDANAFAAFTLLHVLSGTFVDSMSANDRFRFRGGLTPTEGLIALVDFVSRVGISDQMGKIRSPTLVIGMKEDQLVPVRYAREFRDAIPGAEYIEIDSGHAVATGKPAELIKIIEDFLV